MQNLQQNEIPLHDIKPLIEIHEYSLYYLIGVSLLVVLILSGFIYLAYKWMQNRKRYNKRAEHYKKLFSLDCSNPKKAAYDLTFYGATFKDDSERHLKAYENMLEKLQRYKYKKNVEDFDTDTLHVIELYKGMIDV
ncbi:hypothetical protein FJR45_03800 [Sulfurimonas sediminis]|uniref:DUF4381 domain-containing protein n=1 Tax=Sulfurimonas sediminis TaxID=2590020 RepID=A0A7M1B039_9BACT|nr:hypothetical protein [Sulfurimonas sediminis]QOP43117.1 hypothetical protein FJR45_03800 [Sulfurimonas sediminis]